MSFDLAVWEGERPATDEAATQIYARLMDEMDAGRFDRPPSPAIRAYVDALLDKWPDITSDEGEHSPWADGPLINNASGPSIYFAMVWSKADEAAEFAAQLAAEHGLVCYDPQAETLLPRHSKGGARPRPRQTESEGSFRAWFGRFRRR